MVDIGKVDMRVKLFGTTWQSPIVLDPVGSQRAFHPGRRARDAHAPRNPAKHLQILSTVSSTGVEDVNAARGEPVWYQLYPTDHWAVTQALVKRAEAAGCPVLVLTVDLAGRLQPRDARALDPRTTRGTARPATRPSRTRLSGFITGKPMFKDLDISRVAELEPPDHDLGRIFDAAARHLDAQAASSRAS